MANVLVALDLTISFLQRATQVSALIRQAQEEGRDITSDELDALAADYDAARQKLLDALEAP